MIFIKYMFKFFTTKYNLILSIILLAIFLYIKFIIVIELTNENVTWIYSSSMQTLAALIALLPISYGYYISNIDSIMGEDYDSYIIERLKRNVYFEMMTVILFSVLVIIINLLSFVINYNVDVALLISILSIEGIGLISFYIFRLFDPNKAKEIIGEFDDKKDIDPAQEVISLDSFITEYLELETAVKDFVSNENDNELIDKIPLYDIVDNLNKDFIEIKDKYDTFKEIIFHRNNLIHNYIDNVVDYSKYEKILELKTYFIKLNNEFIQTKIFSNIIEVRKIVENCIKEYTLEIKEVKTIDINKMDMKTELVSIFHSYFISNYYMTHSLEDAKESDFEVVQNNYSERSLLAIEFKTIDSRMIKKIAKSYFNRLSQRYLYLFMINYDQESNLFTIFYQAKDKEIKSIDISK